VLDPGRAKRRVRRGRSPRLARAAFLAVALCAAPARGDTPAQALDEVTLRDGRRIRGRIVEKQNGRWVSVEIGDGRVRTFAWSAVQAIDVAPPPRSEPAEAHTAWRQRGGGRVSWDVRAELAGIVLPARTFAVGGFCAAGTSAAPASLYGQTASDSARAIGGGAGGRVGWMHLPHIAPRRSASFWAFRIGSGLDLHMLHARTPIGIRPADGELCSRIAQTSHEAEAKNESLPVLHVPLEIGVLLALGSFRDATHWHGVVLGAAWSPSFIHVGYPGTGSAASYFHHLGIALTIDFASLQADHASRREMHLRVVVSLAQSATSGQPMLGTVGVGPVWY
jgi:hypothetical protein